MAIFFFKFILSLFSYNQDFTVFFFFLFVFSSEFFQDILKPPCKKDINLYFLSRSSYRHTLLNNKTELKVKSWNLQTLIACITFNIRAIAGQCWIIQRTWIYKKCMSIHYGFETENTVIKYQVDLASAGKLLIQAPNKHVSHFQFWKE